MEGINEELVGQAEAKFIQKGPFAEGQKILVMMDLFDDYPVVYREKDAAPLKRQYHEILQRDALRSDDLLHMVRVLKSIGVQTKEGEAIATVMRSIEKFNGGKLQITWESQKVRMGLYDRAAKSLRYNPVTLEQFQGKQVMECVEGAMVAHLLFSDDTRFEAFMVDATLRIPGRKPEGHQVNLLENRRLQNRFLLVDFSLAVEDKTTDGEKVRIPFCQVLAKEGIKKLEQGEVLECNFLGKKASYQVGDPFSGESDRKVEIIDEEEN